MYVFVKMTRGARPGSTLLLDETAETRIGRDTECDLVLLDPLCSRVHAVILHDEDGWWLRDSSSRNGSYVNGQKIDEARLVDGSVLRVGTTEFNFYISPTPPARDSVSSVDINLTQTIVKEKTLPRNKPGTGSISLEALTDGESVRDLLQLHNLTMRLLACEDPETVVRKSLDVLHERTHASVAGFLWFSDDGQLKPKLVIPEDAATDVALSDSLTKIVCKEGRAVWIDNQAGEDVASLTHYADALCVPLLQEEQTLGAIHLYLHRGRFHQRDFDFTIHLAEVLVVALARARQQAMLTASHQRLVAKAGDFVELLGESEPMQQLKSKTTRIARATGCVLIRGESGSGKELVARAVHRASARADRPMLSVNCAAIPRDLMESQLFGHKKGAFTGADSDHNGWFQQADTGTLFLDEVGELTLEGQAKLLRILEGHPFLPVGAVHEVNVDVRVIAATNRDLREFVRERHFREDLFYRLSVFELYIPPLRERGSDIELLMTHFLDHFKHQHGRPGLQLTDESRKKLLSYNWPGNVRQLRNVIDSAVVMAEGDTIQPGDLGLRDTGSGELESLRIEHWERKLIAEALSRTSGNVPEAAKLLGIGRATLYRKIDEYEIAR